MQNLFKDKGLTFVQNQNLLDVYNLATEITPHLNWLVTGVDPTPLRFFDAGLAAARPELLVERAGHVTVAVLHEHL